MLLLLIRRVPGTRGLPLAPPLSATRNTPLSSSRQQIQTRRPRPLNCGVSSPAGANGESGLLPHPRDLPPSSSVPGAASANEEATFLPHPADPPSKTRPVPRPASADEGPSLIPRPMDPPSGLTSRPATTNRHSYHVQRIRRLQGQCQGRQV